jgi:hypothetical protein
VEQAPRGGRATRIARFVLKVLVVLLLASLVLGLLSFLPTWADLTVTGALALAAIAAPWRPFWRTERETAKTLRHTHSRLVLAGAIAIGGPLFAMAADLWLAHRYPKYADGRWLAGPVWDVLLAAPFYLLTLLVLGTALSRPAAALTALCLAGITALGLWGYASSDSSTAAVSLFAPVFYGFPVVLLAFVIDAASRAAGKRFARRQARESR